jgi:hypothetical protein
MLASSDTGNLSCARTPDTHSRMASNAKKGRGDAIELKAALASDIT